VPLSDLACQNTCGIYSRAASTGIAEVKIFVGLARICPTLPGMLIGMKNLFSKISGRGQFQLIATFGQAKLVLTTGGQLELRGGSSADRVAAKEWISLFMHEAAPKIVPAEIV
jgi:hypothetical protein